MGELVSSRHNTEGKSPELVHLTCHMKSQKILFYFCVWGMRKNVSDKSRDNTHSLLQMVFLITSAVSILKVWTVRYLFNTLKDITGCHLFPRFGTRTNLL